MCSGKEKGITPASPATWTRPDNRYRFFVLDLTRGTILLQGVCLNGVTDAQGIGNLAIGTADAPAGSIDFTDGAYLDSSYVDNAFPYLKTPVAGALKR